METANGIRQWYYRGSLKTCNYACSYCPFSKHPRAGRHELEEDERALVRFVDYLLWHCSTLHCAVQVVPYGEALIYAYYWRELARLSAVEWIDAVGAQTNLSFPVEKMLEIYKNMGGKPEKLRIWATFHPQQTSIEAFCTQCRELIKQGILFCVGAVGVPDNIELLQELRENLPDSVYMWINRMDGMKRAYSKEEIQVFSELDEYFPEELRLHRADVRKCADSCFVEADGTIAPCNLARPSAAIRSDRGNLYQAEKRSMTAKQNCKRSYCSCYLAYCNQKEPERRFFQPYPAFRIPQYPKAVFLDADGIFFKESASISEDAVRQVRKLSVHAKIYLFSSDSYEMVQHRLKPIEKMLAGSVFADGVYLKEGYQSSTPVNLAGAAESIRYVCDMLAYRFDEIAVFCDAAAGELMRREFPLSIVADSL